MESKVTNQKVITPEENNIALLINIPRKKEENQKLSENILRLQEEKSVLTETIQKNRNKIDKLQQYIEKLEQQAETLSRQIPAENTETPADISEDVDISEEEFEKKDAEENEPKETEKISLPYKLRKKTILFGGHDGSINQLQQALPDLIVLNTNKPNVSMLKTADYLWIQPNCLSHAEYYKVINTARALDMPRQHFRTSSAQKAIELIIKKDMEEEFDG